VLTVAAETKLMLQSPIKKQNGIVLRKRHILTHNHDDDDDDDDDVGTEQGHIEGFMVNGGSGGRGTSDGSGVITVRAGNSICIDIQISGSPVPTVSWLKDYTPISPSNRVFRFISLPF